MTDWESKIEIGSGVRLWLHSMGEGSPMIILEAPGPGCDSSPWMAIQPRLAEITRTFRYDRAGTGKSTGTELNSPSIPPRTQDLEQLLEAAPIEPPYVLVGYSLGGAIVLRYARQHLDRMAGLVLIESATEQFLSYTADEAVAASSGLASSLGDLPLVVMTIDTQEYILPPIPDTSPEQAIQFWLDAQAELVTLSTRGRQVFARDTNHFQILESHAVEVIQEIQAIVEEVRRKQPDKTQAAL